MKRSVVSLAATLFVPRTSWDRWGLAGAWMLFLFTLSSFPASRFPSVTLPQFDKFVHFCLYFPLGVLLVRALAGGGVVRRSGLLWRTLLYGAAYGMFDEVYQSFIPQRSSSFADWVVDCLAVAAGGWFGSAMMLAARNRMVRTNPEEAGRETA